MTVKNQHGDVINFDAALNIMDTDLLESLHASLSPCSEQEFYDAYCAAHLLKYADEFEPDKLNGQW